MELMGTIRFLLLLRIESIRLSFEEERGQNVMRMREKVDIRKEH
jgi:hypothetical protein